MNTVLCYLISGTLTQRKAKGYLLLGQLTWSLKFDNN